MAGRDGPKRVPPSPEVQGPMNLPPSDFTSGEAYAAHWNYNEPPVVNICATQGAGFLARLYAALGVAPMLAWGSELQDALIAKATLLSGGASAWTPLIRQLQADLASTRTSRAGHTFGLYVAYYLASNHRLDAISLPTNTRLLQWGVAPADDGGRNGGAVACIDPMRDPGFDEAGAVTESTTGIRVGADRPVPPGQTTLPNSSVLGVEAVVALALVAGGLWWLFGAARANPTFDPDSEMLFNWGYQDVLANHRRGRADRRLAKNTAKQYAAGYRQAQQDLAIGAVSDEFDGNAYRALRPRRSKL